MKVTLLNHTQDALATLLRTKNTRLGFQSDPATWSDAQRQEHLAYMKDTIKSSWEFVDYLFQIEGVTRAFTHQLVRTRTGSYAQESQRTVDVSGHEVAKPMSVSGPVFTVRSDIWDGAVTESMAAYAMLVRDGVPVQDARGLLVTNVTTSIIAKFSLRTLHDMAKTRLCTRTQGEYQNVFREMRRRVIEVHPWVEEHQFLEVACVAEGTCAFPRFGKKECQHYDPRMDLTELKQETRARFWAKEIQVAKPVATNGKTM